MKRRNLTSGFFMILLTVVLLSTFKIQVFAQITPKVSIVSLEHSPFINGDKNEFYISAKNYTGQVQYQLFYIQESVMKDWKLINNVDMVNGWTNPIDAKAPMIVDITNLNLKADKYRFSIRVRRVGLKGLNQNKYGDYDDAYPLHFEVVKNAKIELNGSMEIGKTRLSQEDILTINGVENTPLEVDYKLHLFDVKNSKWLTNLTDYNMNVNYNLKNIPEGTYIVDLWAKNNESQNKYDGFKLKVITINNTTIKVASLNLNKIASSLIVGGTDNVIALDEPSKDIRWTSSSPEIAKVDNTGKITAISAGTAIITVISSDGNKTATCKVTVTNELTAKQIFGKYGDAVVSVEVSDENHKLIANGSGFIVNSNGVVVTNFHVIKDCSYANVTLQNGTKYEVKSVLNYNEKQDIAILQLSNSTNLNIVKLGDSNTMEIGDNVVAIGSPEGYENSLSTGIISGINRKSDRGNDFQTTASISHGSSGGALFNAYGDIIGITYAGYDLAGDIGFVIPINEVNPLLNSSNEKTLMEIKNKMTSKPIPENKYKYFPLLSDIPMPTNASYYKTSLSPDGTHIFYFYSVLLLPDNFVKDYYSLLKNNGWVLYKKNTDSNKEPLVYLIKEEKLIAIGVIENDFVIYGSIR
ncbi:trypsin-like peptidase domain-containing protein [Clostridium tagluense]|uniref:trypsin-like peptidase domain-containing protein n=1 Tax=Clostridium tagluense TaxID=360422 RepID=UPI001CF54377|nr:trypsin-like peptidase domain-containing protein [Clostridium tagluense]MCB2298450.1 trypsin-like peptidase domain-containing protein [Clostridium tagluense]